MNLTGKGSGQWDALAQQQFHKQVAIVLDGIVQSAPTIQPDQNAFSSFGGTAVISGNFTGAEASDLAKLINYGALPVQLKQVNVENVSPTLGKDQLNAGHRRRHHRPRARRALHARSTTGCSASW